MADNGEMRALLDEGTAHFKNKRYKPALEQYTRALRRCPCYKAGNRERCTCKNYEVVISENKSFLDEVMKACQCAAKSQEKCSNELHIHALDSRAAVFEKIDQIDRAKKDAEWILELAPQLPQGYLRLGIIMRRRKSNKMAWIILNAGIEATKNGPVPQHPRVKDLYAMRQPLHRHYSRQDIIQMPIEIVALILDLLDLPSRLRCVAVSKTWRAAFTRYEFQWAWRNLEFFVRLSRSGSGVTSGALKNILGFSGNDVREIIIPDGVRFRLNSQKFAMILRAGRGLRRLEIRQQYEPLKVADSLIDLPKLTHLTADMPSISKNMVLYASETLTYLHLVDPETRASYELNLPILLKVQYLRLTRRESRDRSWSCDLSTYCPNIEQLFVDNVGFQLPLELQGTPEAATKRCPKLKVIIYRDTRKSVFFGRQQGLHSILSLLDDSQIQYLEYNMGLAVFTAAALSPTLDDMTDEQPYLVHRFDNLHILRSANVFITHPWGERLFRGAVDNKVLNSLDLYFPQANLNERAGETCLSYLAGWDWLLGAESIKALSLSNFDFGSEFLRDCPLPAFLKTFPNLETIELSSSHHTPEYVSSVAYSALKDIKTLRMLYADVTGEALYKLQAEATRRGVKFSRRRDPENSTREWPVPLEPDRMLRTIET